MLPPQQEETMTEPVIGKLAAALKGEGVYSAWVGMNEPQVAEALAREAFDTVVLDMQHGSVDTVGAGRGILSVALAGKPAVVRIPVGDFAFASRAADAGAAGVIAPMINSVADAKAFASFVKYPPLGARSWGPRACGPLSGYIGPSYLHAANGITLTIAMIETREALDAVDDILAVEGIDGVFVGPADLSIALSNGGSWDPRGAEVDKALETVAAAAKKAGKFAGLFCFDGAQAKAMRARGFKFTSISADIMLLRAAAKAEMDKARG
jgi:4-hydroxy-2-oxoheptanedioate aldolase